MQKQPQSYSAGALPGISKKGPSFRKDGLHQSGSWVIANKGSGVQSWRVPSKAETPTEAMIKGWPRWAIPGFLEQIPPRLEGCRQRLLAAEIELRRAEKAGGLEVGNASAPQEEDKTPAVAQDLPTLKAPEETHDEYADMPQEAEWILDQVGELETQFSELDTKLQELEASHASARKLRNQYVEDAGTCFATMMELSSRVSGLTDQLKASQGTVGVLKGKLVWAIGNTKQLQKQVAEGHDVATHLSKKLASARALAERYKGDYEAVTEEHSHLRAQKESLENAKFVLEKDVASHQGQLAQADQSQAELRSTLLQAEERLEQLASESKAKDKALRELETSLAAEKEASVRQAHLAQQALQEQKEEQLQLQSVAAIASEPLSSPPQDPRAERADAEAVARLVVKDWVRSARPEPVDSAGAEASAAELAELRARLCEMQTAAEKSTADSSEVTSLRQRLQQETALLEEAQSALRDSKVQLDQLTSDNEKKTSELQKMSEEKDAKLQKLESEMGEKDTSLKKLTSENQEKDAKLQKLEGEMGEKDASLKKLASENQEKDVTIQELQADLETQRERTRVQADASENDIRTELARVEDQLDQLTKAMRDKESAMRQLQETAESEKAAAKAEADATEQQLRGEFASLQGQLEQTAAANQEKDEELKKLNETLEAMKAQSEQEKTQAVAAEKEQASGESREKDAEIARLTAALATSESERREKDTSSQQLLASLDSQSKEKDSRIRQLEAELERERKDKEAASEGLKAALESQKQQATTAPVEALTAAPADPSAARADIEVVARLVVKDWLRTATAAAAPPAVALPEQEPAPPLQPEASEQKLMASAEPSAEQNTRKQQQQWLAEWPCGPKDLQMALVPASVLTSGVDASLTEGQLTPTRLWLDSGTDVLYMQPLVPSGPTSKLKCTSVTSITCSQPSAYDADACLDVEIGSNGGSVRNLKIFSDGEGIESLLAALNRDTRPFPGQLMNLGAR